MKESIDVVEWVVNEEKRVVKREEGGKSGALSYELNSTIATSNILYTEAKTKSNAAWQA